MNENDDLRQLMLDATSDIQPQRTYDDIQVRIENADPVARRWFLPAIAAAVVLGLAIGGTVWMTQDDGSGSGPATGTNHAPVPATIYYAGTVPSDTNPGGTSHALFAEQHDVVALDGSPDLGAAANLAINGTPADPDYLSLWPHGIEVTDAKVVGSGEDRAVEIRLSGPYHARPKGMSDRDQMLAIDAVTRTVAKAAGDPHGLVKFVDAHGNGVQVLGDGGLGTAYGDGGDDTSQLAPVQITNILNGQTVKAGDLEVKGVAETFEGNVQWELLVGGDAVVQSGHATATECCKLAPYTFTVKGLEAGSYTLVVHDTDESGAGLINQDTKEIVVE